MKFFVAAAVATVAFAQDDQAAWNKKARENLPEPLRKMLQKDCDFISEEEFKKMSDPGAAEAAVGKKCAGPCGFVYTGDREADKKANEAKFKEEMEANKELKTDEDKAKFITEKAMGMAKCGMNCAMCKNFSGASALAMGAAAIATAALLM